MPKVSVIIPVYNGEKFIKNALRSVLRQTFKDYEVIVVDDASTDKTSEIVKELQKSNTKIKLIRLEKNSGGPSIPTNTGIKNSKGELIAILEVDDFYLPNFLEKRVEKLERENLDWVIGSAFYFYFPQKILNKYVIGGSVSTWLIKKTLLGKVGYFKPEQDGVQDMGLSLRIKKIAAGAKIGLDPVPLTCCFVHYDSNTYFTRKKVMGFIKRINSLMPDFIALAPIEALEYLRLGSYYCIYGQMAVGRNYIKKSLKLKFTLSGTLLYIISLLGSNFYFNSWIAFKKIQQILEKLKSLYWILVKYRREYRITTMILNKIYKI